LAGSRQPTLFIEQHPNLLSRQHASANQNLSDPESQANLPQLRLLENRLFQLIR
jgi:hypothetical protein